MITSIIDCHGTRTAASATYHAEAREMGTEPAVRFVTASLNIDDAHLKIQYLSSKNKHFTPFTMAMIQIYHITRMLKKDHLFYVRHP